MKKCGIIIKYIRQVVLYSVNTAWDEGQFISILKFVLVENRNAQGSYLCINITCGESKKQLGSIYLINFLQCKDPKHAY
jgi:hypothetical protein